MKASLAGRIGAATTVFIILLQFAVFSPIAQAGINFWSDTGLNHNTVTILAVNPFYTVGVYAITQISEVRSGYKYDGSDWSSISFGGSQVLGFALDPANQDVLYAGTSDQVLKSGDGGGSWTPYYTAPDNYNFNVLTVDPTNIGLVYACTEFNGVMKGTEGNNNWGPENSGLNLAVIIPYFITIEPAKSKPLYLGTNRGIYKSTNNSPINWSPINSGLPTTLPDVNDIVINPVDTSIIYAATSAGLFKSVNAGANWSAAGTGLPTNPPSVWALAIDPDQPEKIYAGTPSGVYRTRDSGTTWFPAPVTGMTNTSITSLAIDPDSPDNLYAGTFGGLFKITFQDPPMYILTYTKTGAGSGRVTSNPPGIDCTGSCSAPFNINSRVDLHAEADSGSFFVEWTGACSGISADCTINPLNSDKSVTANFIKQTDQIVLVKNQYWRFDFSLQSAYNNAQNGVDMLALNAEFVENDVKYDQNKSVTLKGGYSDVNFDTVTGRTTLHGSLTVARGALTVADLIIY